MFGSTCRFFFNVTGVKFAIYSEPAQEIAGLLKSLVNGPSPNLHYLCHDIEIHPDHIHYYDSEYFLGYNQYSV